MSGLNASGGRKAPVDHSNWTPTSRQNHWRAARDCASDLQPPQRSCSLERPPRTPYPLLYFLPSGAQHYTAEGPWLAQQGTQLGPTYRHPHHPPVARARCCPTLAAQRHRQRTGLRPPAVTRICSPPACTGTWRRARSRDIRRMLRSRARSAWPLQAAPDRARVLRRLF